LKYFYFLHRILIVVNHLIKTNFANGKQRTVTQCYPHINIWYCFYGFIGLIFGIIALVISKKSTDIYTANPELYYGYENLKAGRICAIIGIVLSSLYVLVLLAYVVFIGAMLLPWEELLNQ